VTLFLILSCLSFEIRISFGLSFSVPKSTSKPQKYSFFFFCFTEKKTTRRNMRIASTMMIKRVNPKIVRSSVATEAWIKLIAYAKIPMEQIIPMRGIYKCES